MIHAKGCDCFDCRNGYTPVKDRADYMVRKWKKPTGKRPNRTKIIEQIKLISDGDKEEWKRQNDFFKGI